MRPDIKFEPPLCEARKGCILTPSRRLICTPNAGRNKFTREIHPNLPTNCNPNKREPDNRRTYPGQRADKQRTLSGRGPATRRTHSQPPFTHSTLRTAKKRQNLRPFPRFQYEGPANPTPFPRFQTGPSKSPAISNIHSKKFSPLVQFGQRMLFKKRNRASLT